MDRWTFPPSVGGLYGYAASGLNVFRSGVVATLSFNGFELFNTVQLESHAYYEHGKGNRTSLHHFCKNRE